jgi:hypothetical protein
LGAALFNSGCNNFTDADFTNAGLPAVLRSSLCTMAAQDATHANSIQGMVESAKGLVVPPCTYQDLVTTDPVAFVYGAIKGTSAIIGFYLGALEVRCSRFPSEGHINQY